MAADLKVPVIVIGAGPSGSMAALELARADVPVTILNRDKFPGEHNVCGGAIAASVKTRLGLSSAQIDKEIAALTIYYKCHSHTVASRSPQFLSVQRDVFDRHLANNAVFAGAELLNGVNVIRVDPAQNRVYAEQNGASLIIDTNLIIFADGPNTIAHDAYRIGFNRQQDYFVAMHYDVAAPDNDDTGFSFFMEQEALPTGYFWIFPKRDVLNVGVGSYYQMANEIYYRQMLESFITEQLGTDLEIVRKQGGVIPAVPARRFSAAGALVVGDAAGLVNPLTGGGLIHAMKSGEIAGKVAAMAYSNGDFSEGFLRRYEWRLRSTPHYVWIRFMYLLARYHLYRSENSKSGLLELMLTSYFLILKTVLPRVKI